MTGDRNSIEGGAAPQTESAGNAARRRFLRGGLVASGPLLVTLANRPALAWNQYCNGTMPKSLAMSRQEQITLNCQAMKPSEWKFDCDVNGGETNGQFTGCSQHPFLKPNKTWAECKTALNINLATGGASTDTLYYCLGDLADKLRAHIVAGCLNASRWGNPNELSPEEVYDTYGFRLTEFCDWINTGPPDLLTRLQTIHGGD